MDNIDKDDLSLKFDILIDHIIAKKNSQPILRDIFSHPSGAWVNQMLYKNIYATNKTIKYSTAFKIEAINNMGRSV